MCQLSGATWAFTAVKGDGSAVTWGDERKGGDSSAVQDGSGRLKLVTPGYTVITRRYTVKVEVNQRNAVRPVQSRCKRRPLWIIPLFGRLESGAARAREECLRIFLVLRSIET